MIDWVEKARQRLGLEGVDPDHLPDFGEDEAESFFEKYVRYKEKTDKTAVTLGENAETVDVHPLPHPLPHLRGEDVFSNPEEKTNSENRADKTDKTAEPTKSLSQSELLKPQKLTKPPLEDHRAQLTAAARARPPDVSDDRWDTVLIGLWAFLEAGHGDEAERLGWTKDELFRIPSLWSQISLCGCAPLIGDREVTSVTATEIRIKTASGASQAFYRKPQIDYRVAYEAHLRVTRGNYKPDAEEAHLRALERTVGLFREKHPDASIEEARAAVMAAINPSATKETTAP